MANRHSHVFWLSRRTFLGSGFSAIAQAAYPAFLRRVLGADAQIRSQADIWPRFLINREEDELYLTVTAVGYKQRAPLLGERYLEPVSNNAECRLIFTLPPQHYAEAAIGVRTIPDTIDEAVLSSIVLSPSRPSVLVFAVPRSYRLLLTLPHLLDWKQFELLLPDLDRTGSLYDLVIPEEAVPHYSRVEMPWGIDLSPLGHYARTISAGDSDRSSASFFWDHDISLKTGVWKEIWNTSLRNSEEPNLPNRFEVLSVRGFLRGTQRGSTFAGDLVVDYSDDPKDAEPGWLAGLSDPVGASKVRPTTALTNFDRISLAATLSRRFPYSGQPGTKPVGTGSINYISPFNPTKQLIKHCYELGRALFVKQFRLSARGGWLDFDSHWTSAPDCGLTGWSHSLSLGRDRHVELEKAGFLYPFGIAANLIVVTDQAFVRDEHGHFVAVLLKQVFIEVPQPNSVPIANKEGIFSSLSVTTSRTDSLDVPLTGDPGTYLTYDYFVPTVDGRPFLFEHTGIDWAGSAHSSKTPLVFVSNDARLPNGLIWEPGLAPQTPAPPTGLSAAAVPSTGLPATASSSVPQKDPNWTIQASGDGLRVVDKLWLSQPYRFANYNDALTAVASPLEHGDTTQRVNWAEWTRGQVPPLDPSGIAPRPFSPRTRTVKLQLHGMTQFSGENKYSLATYRDVRYISGPLLDPEPSSSPEVYKHNLLSSVDLQSPYLLVLETRDLHDQPDVPAPDPPDIARKRIRSIYYGTSTGADTIPDSLFADIDNELQFGMSSSSAQTGGLVVPDTPVSTITRRYGPVGDATFSASRWQGYAKAKPKLESAHRLDFAAFRLSRRSQMDKEPYDTAQTPADVTALTKTAASFMGYANGAAPAALTTNPSGLGLQLGDIFGAGAEILPGLSFAQLFSGVGLQSSASTVNANTPPPVTAEPLTWQFRITGLEWLTPLLGSGPGQLSFKDLIAIATTEGQSADTSAAVELGAEASLHWNNRSFTPVTIGPLQFTPNPATEIALDADVRASLGISGLPADFSDLKLPVGHPQLTAKAVMSSFTIAVFGAIEVDFASVEFEMSADGKKTVSTKIADVRLIGPLEFINQLSKVLGGLGGDTGMDIDISLARVRVSQTLKFPKADGGVLFVGPAQITNLSFSWAVMIPLVGRDVLSISFALSTREKPLTIFVPPWYGGKAHVLIELTTKGLRLLEVSMEYGALISITWGIATGQASLTAGIFYMLEKVVDGKGALVDGKVIFRAFVSAAADLSVAGIIRFSGEIYISLSYVKDGARRVIVGEAKVSCSIKIGFIRVSYSFSATHEESQGGSPATALVDPIPLRAGRKPIVAATYVRSLERPLALTSLGSRTTGHPNISAQDSTKPQGAEGEIQLFGHAFDEQRRAAFERLLKGYVA
jgi:hypothetical protein